MDAGLPPGTIILTRTQTDTHTRKHTSVHYHVTHKQTEYLHSHTVRGTCRPQHHKCMNAQEIQICSLMHSDHIVITLYHIMSLLDPCPHDALCELQVQKLYFCAEAQETMQ